jgi:hypothetical protein
MLLRFLEEKTRTFLEHGKVPCMIAPALHSSKAPAAIVKGGWTGAPSFCGDCWRQYLPKTGANLQNMEDFELL